MDTTMTADWIAERRHAVYHNERVRPAFVPAGVALTVSAFADFTAWLHAHRPETLADALVRGAFQDGEPAAALIEDYCTAAHAVLAHSTFPRLHADAECVGRA